MVSPSWRNYAMENVPLFTGTIFLLWVHVLNTVVEAKKISLFCFLVQPWTAQQVSELRMDILENNCYWLHGYSLEAKQDFIWTKKTKKKHHIF